MLEDTAHRNPVRARGAARPAPTHAHARFVSPTPLNRRYAPTSDRSPPHNVWNAPSRSTLR